MTSESGGAYWRVIRLGERPPVGQRLWYGTAGGVGQAAFHGDGQWTDPVSGVAHGPDFSPLYWMPEMTQDRTPMPPGHGAGSPPPVGDEMLMVCCGKTGTAMARYDATLGIWMNNSGFEIHGVRFWKTLAEYQSDFAAHAESAPLPVTPVEPPLDDDASGGAGGLVGRVFTWLNQRVRPASARRRSRAWADPKTVHG